MTSTLDRIPVSKRPTGTEPDPWTRSPFARLAGPMAVTAGDLITVAQLVMLPFDPKDHVSRPLRAGCSRSAASSTCSASWR